MYLPRALDSFIAPKCFEVLEEEHVITDAKTAFGNENKDRYRTYVEGWRVVDKFSIT